MFNGNMFNVETVFQYDYAGSVYLNIELTNNGNRLKIVDKIEIILRDFLKQFITILLLILVKVQYHHRLLSTHIFKFYRLAFAIPYITSIRRLNSLADHIFSFHIHQVLHGDIYRIYRELCNKTSSQKKDIRG